MRPYSSRLRAAILAGLLGMVAVALLVVTPVAEAQSCPTPYATPPARVHAHTYQVDYYVDPSYPFDAVWNYFTLSALRGVTFEGATWITRSIVRVTYRDIKQDGTSVAEVYGYSSCSPNTPWHHTTTFKRG